MADNTPLHALAVSAVEAIVATEPGERSRLPPGAFAKVRQTMLAHRDERLAFVHLCVLWHRLKQKGMLQAAEQMLALARIGLDESEVEKATQALDQARETAESLKAQVQGRDPTKGLSPAARGGVGLRGGAGKNTRKL